MPTRQRFLVWAVVMVVLALVFLLYFHPELVIDLARQMWTCT
ncbi:hypothetical protein [Aquabacterium sp.]